MLMKKIFILTVIFLAGSISFISMAQTQFTGWTALFTTFKTGKKTSIHADVQIRSSDELKQVQTLLLRTGLNIHLSKKIIITAGYAFIHNKRSIGNVSGYVPEHRVWEQLIYTHKLKNIFVAHRFRLEQRFISKTVVVNNELENEGNVYANRFRYFIRNILPFKTETSFKKGMFAALQNEVFLNIGNTRNVNGSIFDQNRLYLALGYRLHTKADLEIGYMNQYVNGRSRQLINNHIVQLAGYLRL